MSEIIRYFDTEQMDKTGAFTVRLIGLASDREMALQTREKQLRAGHTIIHTGEIHPAGAIEEINWKADLILQEDGNITYAEFHRNSEGYMDDKVRGTLERTVTLDGGFGETILISSKKTYRKD